MDFRLKKKNYAINYEKERKIKEIINDEFNSKCMDCQSEYPEYISLNNGIFICADCYNRHKKFPKYISDPVENDINSLTMEEIQYLYYGGNKRLNDYIKYEYPKLKKFSSFFIYKTNAMEYYRNWLKYLVEGGIKPIKPDINNAYASVVDNKSPQTHRYSKTSNISALNSNNNNDGDVITIDFYNDCYNYNDKFNRTITNFINKKNPDLDDSDNKIRDNSCYSNRGINEYNNLGINNNFQRNFYNRTKTNNNFANIRKNYRRSDLGYNNENAILQRMNQPSYDFNNNPNIRSNNFFNNYKQSKKIIKAFKTNNKIYVKPKQTILNYFQRDIPPNNQNKNILIDQINSERYDNSKEENNAYITNINISSNYYVNDKNDQFISSNKKNNNQSSYYYGNIPAEMENSPSKNEKLLQRNMIYNKNINIINPVVFKKKNLKNSFFINNANTTNDTLGEVKPVNNNIITNDNKNLMVSKKNFPKVEHQELQIISKNEKENNDEEVSDSGSDSDKKIKVNKKYVKITKNKNRIRNSKGRKTTEDKNEESLEEPEEKTKEGKYEKLKREKSQILKSLTSLLKAQKNKDKSVDKIRLNYNEEKNNDIKINTIENININSNDNTKKINRFRNFYTKSYDKNDSSRNEKDKEKEKEKEIVDPKKYRRFNYNYNYNNGYRKKYETLAIDDSSKKNNEINNSSNKKENESKFDYTKRNFRKEKLYDKIFDGTKDGSNKKERSDEKEKNDENKEKEKVKDDENEKNENLEDKREVKTVSIRSKYKRKLK